MVRTSMVRIMARLLLLILVASSVNGCSLTLLKKPRLADGPAARDCTTSRVAPALDAAAAGLVVVGLARGLTHEPEGFDLELISDAAAVAMLTPPALLSAYSAARGFGWTSECRRRQALSEEAIAAYLRTLVTPSVAGPGGSVEELARRFDTPPRSQETPER